MKALFKRTYSGFEPVDENAQKILRRYKVGDLADLENKATRNIKFHRKFFAIINLTFQNQDITNNENDFREAVTIQAGWFHWVKLINGKEIERANSISFSKMDDIEFEALYNSVFDVCLKILGCKSEELELELLSYV